MEEDTGKSLHVGGSTGRIHGADAQPGRLQPGRHPAHRDRHQADDGRGGAGAGDRPRLRGDAARPAQGARRLRRADGAGLDALRRQPVADAQGRHEARHPLGDQERQLAALGRAGGALRGRPPRRDADRGRHDRAGDPALARGHRRHDVGPGEVRRRRLPLLPRARPRAGRAVARVGRRAARHAARAAGGAPQAAAGRLGLRRPRDARRRQRRRSSSSSRRPSPRAPRRRRRASGGRARSPAAPTPRARTCRPTPRGWAWARHPSSSSRAWSRSGRLNDAHGPPGLGGRALR